ncbi:Gldg family protein [Kordiimonas gwangyangensis]|uniref:Gldg family protein n=1 Tax=Kordiimonas gwangyangensis TaxID=288022 RepID=UPI000370E0B0|nr:Gldg family protein [Kordiimonas gwangyangensis]
MAAPVNKLMQKTSVQIVLAVLLFLSLTVLADRYLRSAKIDLTDEGLYTLSEGTEGVLSNLDEPVSLTYYFSRSLATPYPQLLSYGKRVEDMLRAFVAENPGKVHLSVVDPEPFSEAEDEAVAAGLKGVPLMDRSTLYMGLVASNTLDGEGAIPFFTEEREKFLEYDLVKLVTSLDTEPRPRLSLLTQLPLQFGPGGPQAMMQGRSQPYVIYEQLQEFFTVEDMAPDFTEIPAETEVLMLVHPPALSDDQLFAIDQYVLKGGRALIFLDPHSEALDPRGTAPSASTLGPLLAAWGVEMPEGKVVGDGAQAQRVQMGGYGPESVKDYIFWLNVSGDFLNGDDIVTGALDNINVASAGVLEPLEGATTKLTPLMTTSSVAMLYDADRAVGMPDPDALLRDLEPTGKSYILATRISGTAKTAYPDRVANAGTPTADPAAAEGELNIVLASDSDLFDDRFWVQLQELLGQRIVVPIAGNGSFVLNLADHISGSDALLALRGRGISKRPFEVVDRLRREAEAKYLTEEQRLQDDLANMEDRLAQLESAEADGTSVLSPEMEEEKERFRAQLLETRRALREVNRSLRAEIESLGNWLAVINIVLVPFLLIVFALVRVYVRRRRAASR